MRLWMLALLAGVLANAQTTQGVISGEVRDSLSDAPLAGAKSPARIWTPVSNRPCVTDTSGATRFRSCRPATMLEGFRPVVSTSGNLRLNLAVGGRLAVRFQLRPLSDVWETGQYRAVIDPDSNHVLRFFGPDVDPNRVASVRANQGESSNLDTSVSYVIDSALINDLRCSAATSTACWWCSRR